MAPSLPPELPTPPERRFTLPPLAWLGWALYGIVCIAVFQLQHQGQTAAMYGDTHGMGFLLGQIVGSLAVPVGLSWVVWLCCRRSPVARNATFFVVFGLMMLGQVGQMTRRVKATVEMVKIQSENQRETAERRAAVERGETVDEKKVNERVRRTAEQMGELAQTSSGQERAVAEASQAFMQKILRAKERYDATTATFTDGGFWVLKGLTTKTLIADRRRDVAAFAVANSELARLQDASGTAFRRELEQRKVTRKVLESTLASYLKSSARLQAAGKIRESDGQLSVAMSDLLDLAETNLGRWKTEAGSGKIVFDEDNAAAAYAEITERVNRIAAEQATYQRIMLGTK